MGSSQYNSVRGEPFDRLRANGTRTVIPIKWINFSACRYITLHKGIKSYLACLRRQAGVTLHWRYDFLQARDYLSGTLDYFVDNVLHTYHFVDETHSLSGHSHTGVQFTLLEYLGRV